MPSVTAVPAKQIIASFGKVLDRDSDYHVTRTEGNTRQEEVEIFFSHVWGSNPKSRLMGILWYLNWNRSVLMAIFISLLVSLLMTFWVDGRMWTHFEQTTGLTARSVLAIIGTIVLIFFYLGFEHILPRHKKCFLDRCSIDQTSTPRKVGGMREIPSILSTSTTLVVLLSEEYFDRLWCVYEVAIFKSSLEANSSTGKRRRIVFIPLRVVTVAILLMLVDLVSTVLFRSNIRSLLSNEQKAEFLWISATFSTITAGLIYAFCFLWYEGLDRYREQLSKFSLDNAKCTEESDRTVLAADIEERFKGVENFEKYVHTELFSEIGSRPRMKYLIWICLPSLIAVIGYVNVITQRMGLFCFRQMKDSSRVVKRDDSFCVILDRTTIENLLIMMVEFISRLLYYPVVVRITLLFIQLIRKTSKIVQFALHLVGLAVLGGITLMDSMQYENTLLVQGIEAAILGAISFAVVVTPRISNRLSRRYNRKVDKSD